MRTLLVGPAGSGKTHRVLERVRALVLDGRADRSLCLLPSYGQVEHVKRRFLSFLGRDAYFDVPFSTFTALYERALPGRRLRELAGPLVRRALMARAIAEADVPLFRAVARTPGLRDAALRLVKELGENGLDAAQARAELGRVFRDPGPDPAAERAHGFLAVFERYEALLDERGLLDHERALAAAARAIEDGALDGLELVAADGFQNFTGLQRRILEALVRRVPECWVTLPGERAGRDTLFHPAAATRTWLLEAGGFRPEFLESGRRASSPGLARLERDLFREGAAREAPPDDVRLLVAPDRAGEVERVAREIAGLREERPDLDLRDFGLIVRDVAVYEELVEERFARHGLPVRAVNTARTLRREPLARAFHRLARTLLADAFDPEDPLAWLRSGFFPAPDPAAFHRALDRFAARGRAEGLPADRAAFLERLRAERGLEPAAAALERARDRLAAAADPARALLDELERLLRSSLYRRRAEATQARAFWEERYRREEAARRSLVRLLEDASEALQGDTPEAARPERLLELLEQALASAPLPVRDLRLNCVNLIDADEARHWDGLRIVFVLGLIEGEFPRRAIEDVFLRDHEREKLNRETEVRLREARGELDEERFLFYVACTRARERLCLSVPAHTEDGTPTQPSFFLEDLAALYPPGALAARPGAVETLPRAFPEPGRARLRLELERFAAEALATPFPAEGPGADRPRLAAALYDLHPRRSLFRGGVLFLRPRAGRIPPDLRPALAAAVASVDASQVNTWLACSYRHFLAHVVGLREPSAPAWAGFDPRKRGGLVHRVLERFVLEGRKRPLAELLEETLAEKKFAGLGTRAERELFRLTWLPRLEAFAGRDAAESAFRPDPALLERRFEGVALEPGVVLHGEVDRVDVGPGGAIVVDYKTGRGFVSAARKQVLSGDNVQLPLYALAVERLLGRAVVGMELFPVGRRERGGLYRSDLVPEDEPRAEEGARTARLGPDEWRELLERTRARVAAMVRAVRAGGLRKDPRDPREECRPERCRLREVCRPDVHYLIRERERRAAGGGAP
jgi:ATP-dependent helicase/nuclease subunit B